jgi:hypothetical protein
VRRVCSSAPHPKRWCSPVHRVLLIQFKVRLEDIDPGSAQEAEVGSVLVVAHRGPQLIQDVVPGFGDPCHLQALW